MSSEVIDERQAKTPPPGRVSFEDFMAWLIDPVHLMPMECIVRSC
jgi:hypothetical protein